MSRRKTMIEGFWERFEECIQETGLNKVQLGKVLGCDRKVLYNDYDNRALSMLYVARFCATYGFSADYLLGISKEKKRIPAAAAAPELKEVRLWEPVPGYDGRYEVSYTGQVRQICGKKSEAVEVYEKRSGRSRYLVVRLGEEEVALENLVYMTYRGPVPEGCSIAHKDERFDNNDLDNLVVLSGDKERSHRLGRRGKAVLKLTPEGELVRRYESVTEAAADTCISYCSVISRCNGSVKTPVAQDGYMYMWEEDAA